MKFMKKIMYVLFISCGISFSGLAAAAGPFELIDQFIKGCMANDTAGVITLFNQNKGAYILFEEKKISLEAMFLGSMDLGTQTSGLMYAVHHQNIPLIRFLLEQLSKVRNELNYNPVDRLNHTGCTALHIAARKGNKEIVGLLLQSGATLNLADMCSMTALHSAAIGNHPEIITILLEAGIDASIKDSEKKMTAKEVTIMFKHDAAIQAFETFESKK